MSPKRFIKSRLTGVDSLPPPVYIETWPKRTQKVSAGHHFPPYGTPHMANMWAVKERKDDWNERSKKVENRDGSIGYPKVITPVFTKELSPLSNSELSMFVNALLVTCHNPRHFYGNNLVQRLKTQVEETQNSTHPLAYLALCNANETWPSKANSDLNDVLSSNSEYPFIKDLQAMAILALSCKIDQSNYSNNSRELMNLTLYHSSVEHFKQTQLQDGSFGNVYTTTLITQVSEGEAVS
ncbi:CUB domain-containing protein [Trichonephila clavipes]|nr:CUB domain-containing protein [Trichonephila clavipes]